MKASVKIAFFGAAFAALMLSITSCKTTPTDPNTPGTTQKDTAFRPKTGSWFITRSYGTDSLGNQASAFYYDTATVVADSVNYQGKTGVVNMSGRIFFKYENNGNIASFFSRGNRGNYVVHSGWLTIPTGSHNAFTFTAIDTQFTIGTTHYTGLETYSETYTGDQTITVKGVDFLCAKIREEHYTDLQGYESSNTDRSDLYFAMSLGWITKAVSPSYRKSTGWHTGWVEDLIDYHLVK